MIHKFVCRKGQGCVWFFSSSAEGGMRVGRRELRLDIFVLGQTEERPHKKCGLTYLILDREKMKKKKNKIERFD